MFVINRNPITWRNCFYNCGENPRNVPCLFELLWKINSFKNILNPQKHKSKKHVSEAAFGKCCLISFNGPSIFVFFIN